MSNSGCKELKEQYGRLIVSKVMSKLVKAKSLFEQKKYVEVIKLLKNSKNSEELSLKGYSLQKLEKWEEAMQVWNSLIILNDLEPYYYLERGVCKFRMRFPHVLEDFDKAVNLNPNNPYFYSCRAYVKDKIGDSEGAIEDYTKAHQLDPEDALILNNLGLAEQKLGYTHKARQSFEKSNDIIGYEEKFYQSENISKEKDAQPKEKSTIWQQIKLMMSSKQEFRKFLKEAFSKEA
jgi:tetratricopeptide (TPR) repeat protein